MKADATIATPALDAADDFGRQSADALVQGVVIRAIPPRRHLMTHSCFLPYLCTSCTVISNPHSVLTRLSYLFPHRLAPILAPFAQRPQPRALCSCSLSMLPRIPGLSSQHLMLCWCTVFLFLRSSFSSQLNKPLTHITTIQRTEAHSLPHTASFQRHRLRCFGYTLLSLLHRRAPWPTIGNEGTQQQRKTQG